MTIQLDELTTKALEGDKEMLLQWCSEIRYSKSNEGFLVDTYFQIYNALQKAENNADALFLAAYLSQYRPGINQINFIEYYDKAVELKHPEAMLERANYYQKIETTSYRPQFKYPEAIDLYRKIIDLEEVHNQTKSEAMMELGMLYQRGHGIKQDYDEALHYYEEALKLGHPEASHNIEHNKKLERRVSPANKGEEKMKPPLAEINKVEVDHSQQDILQKIEYATQLYLQWMKENTKGFRFFRLSHFFHGNSGEKRARNILTLIQEGKDQGSVLDAVQKAYEQSACRQHSYSRYLYDAFKNTNTVGDLSVSDKDFRKLKEENKNIAANASVQSKAGYNP